MHAQWLSCLRLFVTAWSVACQDPLSMGFSRQEYWSGMPSLSPEDLPDPGIEPASLALGGGLFTTSTTWEASISTFFFLTLPTTNDRTKEIRRQNASINNNNQDFRGDPVIKNLPVNVETRVRSLIWEYPTCHRATKLLHPRTCVWEQKKPLQ